MLACAAALFLPTALAAQPDAAPPAPRTRAEQTDWQATSTHADVDRFLAGLAALPHGDRIRCETIGRTVQGRPLRCVRVRAREHSPALRALVIANIHGGEVEGKEVVQILLREIALGEHDDLLRDVEFAFVPVFNADGNDEIDRGNRVDQNGPDGGVGRRHNSQDRDLNRDFIKVESPEVRALLATFASFAPHLFMDLHATNGSYHGYHLTYCTSLNANTDPALRDLMHDRFLPAVRTRMHESHGLRIFDYGNFGRSGPQSGWSTFSADPRLAINYVGLHHCLSLLSEAYSYLPFAERARATRAFVLESVRELVVRKDEVLCLRAAAEARAAELPFCFGHELAPPVQGELLVGAVDEVEIEGLGVRRIARPEFTAIQAPLRTRFVARAERTLPEAWAIVGDFPLVAQVLRAHAVPVFTLGAPVRARTEAFVVRELARQRAPFQGHRLVRLGGELQGGEHELPAGTLVVPARHGLARLAAQLLEAESDDGLATWGFFDGALHRADETDGLGYPVLRLLEPLAEDALRPVAADASVFPALVPYEPAFGSAEPRNDPPPHDVAVVVEVAEPGKRLATRGFEAEARFEGRVLRYRVGDAAVESLDALGNALASASTSGEGTAPPPAVALVRRGRGVRHPELVAACAALQSAGVRKVLLWPDWIE